MSDIAFNDIMARVDAFSCEQKKTLLAHLKQSLKGNLSEKRIRLARGKKTDPWIARSFFGLIKELPFTLGEDIQTERIVSKYESIV
ncbi:MAG: hypothetical protein HDR52_07400 [Treponema sp.]|nr:hypothetical protein [Treponema sp.]